ncbi:MAG: CPBP family intramembrane metalloprotease [Planctomycetes bacterium]|nr:CPBP family intramembrane metalloprotease [Planctomycetota bacterium]
MSNSQGPRQLFRGALIFHGSMGIISIIGIVMIQDISDFVRPAREVVGGFAIGIGFGSCAAALSLLLSKVWRRARILETRLAQIFEGLTVGEVFVLALLSSVAEELLFRGLLQPVIGLWLASALFGLAHWTGDRRLSCWPLISLIAGLALGKLSLWEPAGLSGAIGAHFAVNWIGLARLRRSATPPSDGFSEAP